MPESFTLKTKSQPPQKPPLSGGRIAGEMFARMGVGFAAGLPPAFGFLLWMGPLLAARDCFGVGAIAALVVSLFFVFPMAYGLASGVGVYLVGRIGKQTGSFLLTLGCGFAGGLAIMGMDRLVHSFYWSYWFPSVSPCVLVPLVLLIPPITATFGFNLTRRYKKPPSS